jgi:hypothetical protein
MFSLGSGVYQDNRHAGRMRKYRSVDATEIGNKSEELGYPIEGANP